MAKLSVQPFYPVPVRIDGVEINCRVARLSAAEFFAFARDFDKASDPPSERKLTLRISDEEREKRPVKRARTQTEEAAADALVAIRCLYGDSQGDNAIRDELLTLLSLVEAALPAEPDDAEEFVLTDAEVRARRLESMTPAEREAWSLLDAEDERFASTFIVDTITRHVQVEPGEIDGPDGDITSGADLVRFFGGHGGALKELVRAVRDENMLPTPLKNALRSARASITSSNASDPAPHGQTPESPAQPAASEASAPNVAVTA